MTRHTWLAEAFNPFYEKEAIVLAALREVLQCEDVVQKCLRMAIEARIDRKISNPLWQLVNVDNTKRVMPIKQELIDDYKRSMAYFDWYIIQYRGDMVLVSDLTCYEISRKRLEKHMIKPIRRDELLILLAMILCIIALDPYGAWHALKHLFSCIGDSILIPLDVFFYTLHNHWFFRTCIC